MKIFKNLNISKKYQKSAIAIGNFDGVHKGHQKVFYDAKRFLRKRKIKLGVLTFDPLPFLFFNKKIKNFRITDNREKFRLLKKNNINFVIEQKFNLKFSKINAYNFLSKIIREKIKPQYIFVSNNFRFGNKRKGDINLLNKFSKIYKYKLLKIRPLKYKNKIISSTRIRKCIQKGYVILANQLLSRTWFIDGNVIRGKKLGRKLGYRTCNVNVKNYILPKAGIYAVKIAINKMSKIHNGVAYLGSRPTFGGKTIFLEINIFGIKKNLYKKKIRVYFLKFIRGDKKFKNSIKLVKQMNKDVILAKKGLKTKLVL